MLSVNSRPALNASELWSTDISTMTMPRIQSSGTRRSLLVADWTTVGAADGAGASAAITSGAVRRSAWGIVHRIRRMPPKASLDHEENGLWLAMSSQIAN